jgi:hypothetical protein
LIDAGTSFSTAGSAAGVLDELPELAAVELPDPPELALDELLLLLPQPATTAMQAAAMASASQLLQIRI